MTIIRPLLATDEPIWRELWAGYLTFYETDLPDALTDALFKRLLDGKPHFAFVAEDDGKVIGFVHGLPHASTWAQTGYCYLEDLYVVSEKRGNGAGRALINAVYEEAEKRGLTRVYWHTNKVNVTARKLYDKVATLSDFVQYRSR